MVNSLAPVAKAAETLHPMTVLPSRRKNKLRSHDCDFFKHLYCHFAHPLLRYLFPPLPEQPHFPHPAVRAPGPAIPV